MRGAALAIAALLLLGACGGSAPEVPVGVDGMADPALVAGRDIWSSRCANCHGSDGGGGRGPRVSDGRLIAAYPDLADAVALIANGKAAMPAFGSSLAPTEIDAVVSYMVEVL